MNDDDIISEEFASLPTRTRTEKNTQLRSSTLYYSYVEVLLPNSAGN
jgi:hypothetical protein